jgi:DNA primase
MVVNSRDLHHECINRIEQILEYFGIEYKDNGSYFSMACPVHGGTKNTSCCIYKNSGVYICYSHKCHNETGKDLIGFIRGIHGCSRTEAKNIFINKIAKGLKAPTPALSEKRDFISLSNSLSQIKPKEEKTYEASIVERQTCPPTYLIERGFCPKTLADYKIFTATRGIFTGRVVIPVRHPFKEDKYVGFTARYPGEDYKERAQKKWVHSKNFKTHHNLFNLWEGRDSIEKNGSVIIVEGPLDVLNLVSKGVDNVVGIFGAQMSDNQQYLIESLNPRTILLGLDNDEAGQEAKEKIRSRFERQCMVVDLKFPKKDLGELTQNEVDELIKPTLEKYKKRV